MRGSSYTPARRTAGDEHGDCAEPFRTPRGWGIHTMVVRTEVNGTTTDIEGDNQTSLLYKKTTGSYRFLIDFYPIFALSILLDYNVLINS